jgi:hypothetical protein
MDKNYWKDRPYPLSPSEEDVLAYKVSLEEGTTLLLGCTRNIIPLSDRQMDIDPWYDGETVIIRDWADNEDFYTNIIGDGVLNLSESLSESVLEMCSKCCRNLVVRHFNRKLPTMMVAEFFPDEDGFSIKPKEVHKKEDYTFYIWKFKK